MAYYRVCPRCGAALDPGEICGCSGKERAAGGALSREELRAEWKLAASAAVDGVTREEKEAQLDRILYAQHCLWKEERRERYRRKRRHG